MTLNLPNLEKKILKFWQKGKIFEKTIQKNKKGPNFVFYEGPPFANGLPGIHHLLSRAFKDVILRYKTMQGFFVQRKAGWDTHGLPAEMEAEKKLGIKSKKEIEKIGIKKFIEVCENSVFTYKKEWEEFTKRMGYWIDLKNSYITCSNQYIESLWWILKQIWQKKLLYQDYSVIPYCPRCGTSLSSHEVAQGYKTVKEETITVKFKLINQLNVYLLAWTTTPWTLPGNVALAINPNIEYVKFSLKSPSNGSNKTYIASKKYFEEIKNSQEVKLIGKIKTEELIEKKYKPPYSNKAPYKIVSADFVSSEEGTGIVHMAPSFGIDDMEAAKKNNLPVLITVDKEGKMKTPGFPWHKKFVKEADPEIIKDLEKRGLLFSLREYEHEYPFCWRCKTPLIYYAKNSWFIKTSAVKKEMIENNKKINWVPGHIKNGRFGDWLKEIKDWNLSRERYWGTPLPIWQCKKCENTKVIGSIKELEELSGKKIKKLHRPQIDEIVFNCPKCGEKMKRVPEVVDCWFDSGSMPFAQYHYPFENKELIEKGKQFPADYISEGIDQTRGWFYTLLAVSTLLGFDSPYKNVVCHGLVLDKNGQKMSKSRGNIIRPKEIFDKFGADSARFYFYTINSEADEKRVDFKDISKLYRKIFDTLWQSYNFFFLYKDKNLKIKKNFQAKNLLDKWIFSRLESLNLSIVKNLENFQIVSAARRFEGFVNDLSNWYIRRSRKKFQNPQKRKEALQSLYLVLLKLSKLIAPFAPFFSEELYQKLSDNKSSVHFEKYPLANKKLIDKKLEEKMAEIRKITASALALRAKNKIGVRQPLAALKVKKLNKKLEKDLIDLIKEEINVKKVIFNKKIKGEIELDTKITNRLLQEGSDREQIRNINVLRKKLGLTTKDIAEKIFSTKPAYNVKKVLKETKTKEFILVKSQEEIKSKTKTEVEINGEKHWIAIKK